MTCDECRSLLQDLVDAELSNSERFALEAHMTTCVECARLHRHLAKFTTAMVKTLEPIRAGEDFASKVMARFEESKTELLRVKEESAARPAARTWPVWPFAGAIGLLVLLGLYVLLAGGGPEAVATLSKGRGSTRIMAWDGKGWQEVTGSNQVGNSNQVEAVEAPGAVVELDFGPEAGAQALLRAAGTGYAPHRLLVRVDPGDAAARARLGLKDTPPAAKPTLYVFAGARFAGSVTEAAAAASLLGKAGR